MPVLIVGQWRYLEQTNLATFTFLIIWISDLYSKKVFLNSPEAPIRLIPPPSINKIMPAFDHICLYSDGGSRGNPGPGAIGIVICDGQNQLLYEYAECIGHCTNNQSEYKALIKGLNLVAKYTRRRVTAYSDSELIVKQINGDYRLKNDALRELFHEVKKLQVMFQQVVFQHVPRSNQRLSLADKLLNQAQNGASTNRCLIEP